MPKLFARTIVAGDCRQLDPQRTCANVRSSQAEAALIAKAKGIHDRVIKLDTHNDIEPANFTPDCNYTMRLTTQVNLPKMIEGDMDVSFMIVYVGQGPLTPEGLRERVSDRRSRSSTPFIASPKRSRRTTSAWR